MDIGRVGGMVKKMHSLTHLIDDFKLDGPKDSSGRLLMKTIISFFLTGLILVIVLLKRC